MYSLNYNNKIMFECLKQISKNDYQEKNREIAADTMNNSQCLDTQLNKLLLNSWNQNYLHSAVPIVTINSNIKYEVLITLIQQQYNAIVDMNADFNKGDEYKTQFLDIGSITAYYQTY